MGTGTRTGDLLLADDSLGDVELMRLALEQAGIRHTLHVARDGVEALELLRGARLRPDLVLLDLNMPRLGGCEVLQAMKRDPELRTIPVVVLSTSADPGDVAATYELHVNSYVRKPIGFAELVEVVERIDRFWLQTAELPTA